MLGALNLVAFLLVRRGRLEVPAELWLMLYVNSAVLHIGVYFWNRKHNVSPHEQEGSSGVAGMAMSAMSAPIYVQALSQALLRQRAGLRRDPQGRGRRDHAGVFRRHLVWGVLLVGALIALRSRSGTCTWPSTPGPSSASSCACLPVALWLGSATRRRRAAPARRYAGSPRTPSGEHVPASPVVGPRRSSRPVPQESLT